MSSTTTPVADLTKADLGKTISITRQGVTITGPLTRIEHVADLIDDGARGGSDTRYILGAITTRLGIDGHEFRFARRSLADRETDATIEVLS